MRKRLYSSLTHKGAHQNGGKEEPGRPRFTLAYELPASTPVPQCHNIVSTSQIATSIESIDLQRLACLFPFTVYDRKRFAAITVRLGNPHCTCLLFGSGKLVITGSTSFHACLVASHAITAMLRSVNCREHFEVVSSVIQNIVAHVELSKGQRIDLEALYTKFCECSTYQRTVFPGLILRPPNSPIVLLIFASGRIVCTGGKSYDDIYYGFAAMYEVLKAYIREDAAIPIPAEEEARWDDEAIIALVHPKLLKEVISGDDILRPVKRYKRAPKPHVQPSCRQAMMMPQMALAVQ